MGSIYSSSERSRVQLPVRSYLTFVNTVEDSLSRIYEASALLNHLYEEIALEGPYGITLPSLRIRLEALKDAFPVRITDTSMSILWNILHPCDCLQFYVLTEPRDDVDTYSRLDNYSDSDPFYSGWDAKEPYPFSSSLDSIVEEEVTSVVRTEQLSWQQIMERWNRRFIVCIKKGIRNCILSENNPLLVEQLSEMQYAFLVFIARRRSNGVSSNPCERLSALVGGPKTFYLFKRVLLSKNLVTSQGFFLKQNSKVTNSCLMMLKRFHINYPVPAVGRIMEICEFLQANHLTSIPSTFLYEKFNLKKKTLANIIRIAPNILEITDQKPYDAFLKEASPEVQERLKELMLDMSCNRRIVPVNIISMVQKVQSADHLRELLISKLAESNEEKNPELLNGSDSDEEPVGVSLMDATFKDSLNNIFDSPVRQVIRLLHEMPSTEGEIKHLTGISYTKVKNLMKHGIKGPFAFAMLDVGRSKKKVYYVRGENPPISYTVPLRKQRREFLLQLIQKDEVLEIKENLLFFMKQHERDAGSKEEIDRRSLQRILDDMIKDGLLKVMRIDKLEFLCLPQVTRNHPKILAATPKRIVNTAISPSQSELGQGHHFNYGEVGKLIKRKMLHEFLWYLRHELPCGTDYEPLIPATDALPEIYVNEMSWKRFVSPAFWENGWITVFHIILAMPLRMMASLVVFRHEIPPLKYLSDPEKQYIPIGRLESKWQRYFVVKNPAYRSTILSVLHGLWSQGLVSIMECSETRPARRADIRICLHEKAEILDTRISAPGFTKVSRMTYPVLSFQFTDIESVCTYWNTFRYVSLNTPLGKQRRGQSALHFPADELEREVIKVEYLPCPTTKEWEVAPEKELRRVWDQHTENMGACGLSSDQFVHRTPAWSNLKRSQHQLIPRMDPLTELFHNSTSTIHTDVANLKVTPAAFKAPTPPPKKKVFKKDSKPIVTSTPHVKREPRAPCSNSDDSLELKPSAPKRRKVDLMDKTLSEKNVGRRMSWTPKEDFFVLMVKVASLLLTGKSKRDLICVSWVFVRDIIHEYSPELSIDKNSSAIRRRLHFLCTEKPEEAVKVNVFLSFALSDKDLQQYSIGFKAFRIMRKENLTAAQNMFKEALHKIIARFENVRPTLSLPDTLQELYASYSVRDMEDTKRKYKYLQDNDYRVSVQMATLFSYILSALLPLNMDVRRDNLLMTCFASFPDEVITAVVTMMTSNSVLVERSKTDINQCKYPQKSVGTHKVRVSQQFDLRCRLTTVASNYEISAFLLLANQSLLPLCEEQAELTLPAVDHSGYTSLLIFLMTLAGTESILFEYGVHNLRSKSGLLSFDTVSDMLVSRYDVTMGLTEGVIKLNSHSAPSTNHTLPQMLCDEVTRIRTLARKVISESNREFFSEPNYHVCHQPLATRADLTAEQILLLDFIDNANECGCDLFHLKEAFPDVQVEAILESLIQGFLVFELGVSKSRFVKYSHLQPWLVKCHLYKSISDVKESPPQLMIPEVWRDLDGSLMSSILFTFMENVASKLVRRPTVTFEAFVEIYRQFLMPKTVKNMIKFLQDIDALDCLLLEVNAKPRLFSPRLTYTATKTVFLVDETILRLKPDAITKIALFMHELKQMHEPTE